MATGLDQTGAKAPELLAAATSKETAPAGGKGGADAKSATRTQGSEAAAAAANDNDTSSTSTADRTGTGTPGTGACEGGTGEGAADDAQAQAKGAKKRKGPTYVINKISYGDFKSVADAIASLRQDPPEGAWPSPLTYGVPVTLPGAHQPKKASGVGYKQWLQEDHLRAEHELERLEDLEDLLGVQKSFTKAYRQNIASQGVLPPRYLHTWNDTQSTEKAQLRRAKRY